MAMLNPGDLVWAKMKGYPHWPAMVLSIDDVEQHCPQGKQPVLFFGTNETGFLKPSDLCGYLSNRERYETPKKAKGFQQAVQEIRQEAGLPGLTPLESLSESTAETPEPKTPSSSKKRVKTPKTASPAAKVAKLTVKIGKKTDSPRPSSRSSLDISSTETSSAGKRKSKALPVRAKKQPKAVKSPPLKVSNLEEEEDEDSNEAKQANGKGSVVPGLEISDDMSEKPDSPTFANNFGFTDSEQPSEEPTQSLQEEEASPHSEQNPEKEESEAPPPAEVNIESAQSIGVDNVASESAASPVPVENVEEIEEQALNTTANEEQVKPEALEQIDVLEKALEAETYPAPLETGRGKRVSKRKSFDDFVSFGEYKKMLPTPKPKPMAKPPASSEKKTDPSPTKKTPKRQSGPTHKITVKSARKEDATVGETSPELRKAALLSPTRAGKVQQNCADCGGALRVARTIDGGFQYRCRVKGCRKWGSLYGKPPTEEQPETVPEKEPSEEPSGPPMLWAEEPVAEKTTKTLTSSAELSAERRSRRQSGKKKELPEEPPALVAKRQSVEGTKKKPREAAEVADIKNELKLMKSKKIMPQDGLKIKLGGSKLKKWEKKGRSPASQQHPKLSPRVSSGVIQRSVSPLAEHELHYRPGYVERKSRWWRHGKRPNYHKRQPSPVQDFPMTAMDSAACFKILGRCLDSVGQRLSNTPDESPGAVEGTMDLLMDSFVSSIGPLLSLTRQIPELEHGSNTALTKLWDSATPFMPQWPC